MTLLQAPTSVPRHVAIIMDGNGRWANERNRPRFFGHVRGASKIRPIVELADSLGIQALTLFAFSTENWSRPSSELDVLWNLLIRYLRKEEEELDRKNICMQVIGEVDHLPIKVQEVLIPAVNRLSKNTGMKLSFAVSYGSRKEILRGARLFAEDCVQGKAQPEDLESDQDFERYLWTRCLGDLSNVDLMIRTSGEHRVSNFLLWQSAYAEYIFPKTYWPDFNTTHFLNAIHEFSNRDRRFGKVDSNRKEFGSDEDKVHGVMA